MSIAWCPPEVSRSITPRWVRSPDNYFLPKAVLRKIFRGKFVAALRQAFQNGGSASPKT